MKTSDRTRESAEALDRLREILSPGDTLHAIVKHMGRSGMYRSIDIYMIRDNEPRWVSGLIARAGLFRLDKYDALRVGGREMNTGLHTGLHMVYETSRRLFPDGFGCLGQGCPSNDHANGDWDSTACWHRDGGYALRYQSM